VGPFADENVPDEISALFAWPGYNPQNEPASPGSYWQGGVLDEISDGAIAAIVQQTRKCPARLVVRAWPLCSWRRRSRAF
jgi:hypothetical protein